MTSTVADAKAVIAKRDQTGKILTVSTFATTSPPISSYARRRRGDLGTLQMVSLVLSQDWLRATRGPGGRAWPCPVAGSSTTPAATWWT